MKKQILQMESWFDKEEKQAVSEYMKRGGGDWKNLKTPRTIQKNDNSIYWHTALNCYQ